MVRRPWICVRIVLAFAVLLGYGTMQLSGLAAALPMKDDTNKAVSTPSRNGNSKSVSTAKPGTRPLGGITVSPAFQQVGIAATDTSKEGQIKLTNQTGEPLEFSLAITDFGSLDETGGVLFIGKDQRSLNYRYGLSSWLSLQQDRIVIEAGQTKAILFTVTNKDSMAPGGHYGALIITPIGLGQDPHKVDVQQELTSLLFVKKAGGERYQIGLPDVSATRNLFSQPGSVTLRFHNGGNVHVIPRGIITITDPRGEQVKQGIVNDGSAIILPQAFRQLTVPLYGLNRAWLPGRYTLSVAYRYEGETSLQYHKMTFLYINGWYVFFVLLQAGFIFGVSVNRRFRQAVQKPFKVLFRIILIPYKNLFL